MSQLHKIIEGHIEFNEGKQRYSNASDWKEVQARINELEAQLRSCHHLAECTPDDCKLDVNSCSGGEG